MRVQSRSLIVTRGNPPQSAARTIQSSGWRGRGRLSVVDQRRSSRLGGDGVGSNRLGRELRGARTAPAGPRQLTGEQIAAIRAVMRLFVEDDLANGILPSARM